ncbi:MAG: hypothetical protein INR69_07550 [Mucilaginibacter polytrichastri]|nr:hypothetical protein [Mucilaginibacter polytrichastri]
MKNILYILLTLTIFTACGNVENEIKQKRDSIMTLHDQLMERGEIIVRNKLKLDTLQNNLSIFAGSMPGLDTAATKQELQVISRRLQMADNEMSDWMAAFDPVQEGKSDQEKKKYLDAEQEKLYRLNSMFDTALSQSNDYLQKFKKK